jgi:hypothetical protein
VLEDSLDAVFILPVDGDAFGDVLAMKCNQLHWLEAQDRDGKVWKTQRVINLPVCNHEISTQG